MAGTGSKVRKCSERPGKGEIGMHYGRTIAEGAPERVLNDPNVLAAYLGVEA